MSTKLSLIAVTFSAVAIAAAPGVRVVGGSRSTRSLTAASVSGPTPLVARDMQVDLDLPSGKSGKGRLYILFEPLSGLYLHNFDWEPYFYPTYPFIDLVEAHYKVGVTDDRLFYVGFLMGVVITESAQKASSLDDAEAKSLRWYGDHLPQVEERSYRGQTTITPLRIDRSDFPVGFFNSQLSSRPAQVKVVDMVRADGAVPVLFGNETSRWVLTLESEEDAGPHPRAKVILRRAGDSWLQSPVFAADSERGK
jgi:hypothetical protein